MAFWLRRFFVGLAGVLAISYLGLYRRDILASATRQKLLVTLLLTTTIFLFITSPVRSALYGYPLVHPSLLSLYASVAIGLFLTCLPVRRVLEYIFHGTVIWAIGNFIFWLLDTHATMRLGFLDSQVIYAACVFAIGVLLGLWHYRYGKLPTRYVRIATGFLLLCLLLTQTRSAIVLLVVIVLWKFTGSVRRHWHKTLALITGFLVAAVLLGGYFGRLYDVSYLGESVEYRLNLVQASMPKDTGSLLIGEGVGSIERNIQENSKSYPLLAPDIQDGIRFESSHNYAVDLLVERGIIVTGLYIGLCVLALRRRYTVSSPKGIVQAIAIFLALFLAVNNINIQMEMSLWVCILYLVRANSSKKLDNA